MTTVGAAMSALALVRGELAGAAAPRAPARAAAVRRLRVRLLVWTALWGTVLRNIGASVGVWAAGSLGAAATILIGVVIPAWLFVVFPSWFAFRIAAPRGMRRLAALRRAGCRRSCACAICPASPPVLDVAADRPCPGRLERAARRRLDGAGGGGAGGPAAEPGAAPREIADALAHLPAGARFPWLARVHGVEALVRVGGGPARLGGGGALRAHRAGPTDPPARAGRARHRRRGGAAARSCGRAGCWRRCGARRFRWFARSRGGARPPRARGRRCRRRPSGAHARHVALLEAAARNEEIRADEVFALAAAWQGAIDDAALAALQARALELGVRDGAARALALRDQVLGELALLLARADGELRARRRRTLSAQTLASRAREQQLARIRDALGALDADRAGPAPHPLEAWERWLALRAAWERAEQHGGRAGAGGAVARRACATASGATAARCSHQHGARAAWVVFVMFDWLADRAEYVGDLVAVLANRENARIALASLVLSPPRARRLPGRAAPSVSRQFFDDARPAAGARARFSCADAGRRIWHRSCSNPGRMRTPMRDRRIRSRGSALRWRLPARPPVRSTPCAGLDGRHRRLRHHGAVRRRPAGERPAPAARPAPAGHRRRRACAGLPIPAIACAVGRRSSECTIGPNGQAVLEITCPDQPTGNGGAQVAAAAGAVRGGAARWRARQLVAAALPVRRPVRVPRARCARPRTASATRRPAAAQALPVRRSATATAGPPRTVPPAAPSAARRGWSAAMTSCGTCTAPNGGCTKQICAPPAGACARDADCRLEADYCTGCDCRALATSQKCPSARGPAWRCLVDPCGSKKAQCVNGACAVAP